jgi:hypothetical protein
VGEDEKHVRRPRHAQPRVCEGGDRTRRTRGRRPAWGDDVLYVFNPAGARLIPSKEQIIMLVLCSLSVSVLLRKTLETMLEGSEQGRLCFSTTEIHLQSVDAMAVCVCSTTIPTVQCSLARIPRPVRLNVQLRPLYNFVKGSPNADLSFAMVRGVLWLQLRPPKGPMPIYKVVATDDTTQYYQLPRSCYEHGVSFRLHPDEFVNTILDLAVGGGYLEISIREQQMDWKTHFETGTIAITTLAPARVLPASLARQPVVTNTYLTKFFKQACTIAPCCTGLVLFMQAAGPLVLQFELEHAAIVIAMVPIASPPQVVGM